MTASAISRKRLLHNIVSMAHMLEEIFCELRHIAMKWGKQGWAVIAQLAKFDL